MSYSYLSKEGIDVTWYDLYYRVYGRGDMSDVDLDRAVQLGRITQEQADQIKSQNVENDD